MGMPLVSTNVARCPISSEIIMNTRTSFLMETGFNARHKYYNKSCLLFQTDKYGVWLHDIVLTDYNKFNRNQIKIWDSLKAPICPMYSSSCPASPPNQPYEAGRFRTRILLIFTPVCYHLAITLIQGNGDGFIGISRHSWGTGKMQICRLGWVICRFENADWSCRFGCYSG